MFTHNTGRTERTGRTAGLSTTRTDMTVVATHMTVIATHMTVVGADMAVLTAPGTNRFAYGTTDFTKERGCFPHPLLMGYIVSDR